MMVSWKVALCVLLGGIAAFSQAQGNACPEVRFSDQGDGNNVANVRGCPGLKGPPGLKGDTGPPGFPGVIGFAGEQGDTGNTGAKGTTGIGGLPGLYGIKGERGKLGFPGIPGRKGRRGDCVLQSKGPKNCVEVLKSGYHLTGWYTIYPDEGAPMSVLCDMDTDGGGWIVFQRRRDGSLDFYRDWDSYKRGFGSQLGEFWLGNENIHRLTAEGSFTLRVDLEDFDGTSKFATYRDFLIEDESKEYTLRYGSFTGGTAGDSLHVHKNQPFSTKDQKNEKSDINCAVTYRGGWWFEDCHYAHLNGEYLVGDQKVQSRGNIWHSFRGSSYSLKSSQMKIRPKI